MIERQDWRVQGLWRESSGPQIIVTGLNSSTAGAELFPPGNIRGANELSAAHDDV